jgi:hypothetical protein
MAEMTQSQIRADIIEEIKAVDDTISSLLDWAEADAADDDDLIRHLTHLQSAVGSFLTFIR